MTDNTTSSSVKTLWERLKLLATLKYDYAKLTLAEKLTMIFAMSLLCLIGLFMSMFAIFFLSVALSHWIAESIGEAWSSLIVAGIYCVMLLLVVAFRKQLIINPISKFVTRLII
jgi:flagellar biosynthesis protein FlhB